MKPEPYHSSGSGGGSALGMSASSRLVLVCHAPCLFVDISDLLRRRCVERENFLAEGGRDSFRIILLKNGVSLFFSLSSDPG